MADGLKKVYVLMVSRVFPATHPRAGRPTYFKEKIMLTVDKPEEKYELLGKTYVLDRNAYDAETAFKGGWEPKLHTIRSNYDLWARRAEKINKGEAILSLREWSGSPYNFKQDGSKQVEFLRLEKICVQKVNLTHFKPPVYDSDQRLRKVFIVDKIRAVSEWTISRNDGLSMDDFNNWFVEDFDGCVIQFTDFKY